jgi:hypothetical protein
MVGALPSSHIFYEEVHFYVQFSGFLTQQSHRDLLSSSTRYFSLVMPKASPNLLNKNGPMTFLPSVLLPWQAPSLEKHQPPYTSNQFLPPIKLPSPPYIDLHE